tara:strand:- start:1564 stop:1914 length:351 start_codon:yes stop_codon:yes gene_type:complete
MKKEEIILNRIDNLETNASVNNTCIINRFKRLEETLEETIERFSEISILKSTLNALITSQENKRKIIKDLEADVIELEATKHEFSILCKEIKRKTITRQELIAYANSYIESQNLEL